MTQDVTTTQITKTLQTYGFAEFCQLLQDSIQEGYTVDLESNTNYPTAFGTFYTAILVKKDTVVNTLVNTGVKPLEQPMTASIAYGNTDATTEVKTRSKKV